MLLTLSDQFLRYALVGVAATIGHYGTLILLVESHAVDPVAASLAGFVVGGIVSYFLNRRFTFHASERSHAAAAPRFALIAGVAFGLTGVLMHVFTEWSGLHYLVAQLVTTGIVLVWTFLANRFWTFSH